MSAATTWLNSGWVDFGLIVGWMALVGGLGWRAWRRAADE